MMTGFDFMPPLTDDDAMPSMERRGRLLLTTAYFADYADRVMENSQPIQPVEEPVHGLEAFLAPGDFAVSYSYWFTDPPAALAGRLECVEH